MGLGLGTMTQFTTIYSFGVPTDFINFSSLDVEEDAENVTLGLRRKPTWGISFLEKMD